MPRKRAVHTTTSPAKATNVPTVDLPFSVFKKFR